ncbi:MAG: GNAT family N-acetyltransferase [Burkholderiales bacterium]
MPITLPIEGNGFSLRDYVAADIRALADIEFDPQVKRYLAIPKLSKDEWIKTFNPDTATGWAVVDDNGTLAGRASLTRAKRKGHAELAVVISKAFWGQGLGTKVAKLLVATAFNDLEAKSLISIVHPENRASLRLVRSLGFRRRGVFIEDTWQDGHYIYRLSKGRITLNGTDGRKRP